MRLAIALVLAIGVGVGLAGEAVAALPRATSDRPDTVRGPQVHAIYAVPADGTDRALDTSGAIEQSVQLYESWLASQTGGAELRLDLADGALDVTFVRLKETDAELRARDPYIANVVMSELMADGFGSFTKLYQVYYDGSSSYACGGAPVRSQFAVMYLRGDRCGYAVIPSPMGAADYWEYAMLHDSLHALGFVPSCAPHRSATPNWHVDDSGYDLMWGDSPWWGYPLVLDVGHDDYYLTGRSDCPDFAASPFLTSNPPPPPVLVLANPQIRRTGASVVATVAVTADGITPAAGKTSCSATLRGRSLPGRGSYAAGSARCAWTLPRRARGSLVGRIAVTVEGSHAARTIAVPVR